MQSLPYINGNGFYPPFITLLPSVGRVVILDGRLDVLELIQGSKHVDESGQGQ